MLQIYSAIITPAKFDADRLTYLGAVYEGGALIEQSLRPDAAWKFNYAAEIDLTIDSYLSKGIYVGRFFYHFGHFLIETLPSLHFVNQTTSDRAIVAHPWPETLDKNVFSVPHIRFCLEALRIDTSRIVLANKSIEVSDLLVAPRNEAIKGVVGEHFADVYRLIAKYADRLFKRYPQRVYFSRRKFTGRSRPIKNEEDIEKIFQALGFEVFFPEALSFRDQVNIASHAKVIAGIDGSALHLCCFMRGGTCLVINTRPRSRSIAALNTAAGVVTDWIDGACHSVQLEGEKSIVIDKDRILDAITARTWL